MLQLLSLLSGTAALLYQLAWGRLLALSIGATGTALAGILAAIFLGMAAGSFAARRWLERGGSARRGFIFCEAMTALGGVLLMPLLLDLDGLLATVPGLGRIETVRFLLALLLLFVPAAAIGAVVPLLTAWRDAQGQGEAVGTVYGFYTGGALFGVLAGGFLILPALGLDGAVWLAALVNLAALGVAWRARLSDTVSTAPAFAGGTPLRRWAVAVAALNGFVALGTQVAWGKLLVLVTGSTLFGHTLLLAAVLLGIALGALFYHSLAQRRPLTTTGLRHWLLLQAALVLFTREGIAWLATPAAQGWLDGPFQHYLATVVVLLPVNIVFGVVLPHALALAYPERRRIGSGYGWNILAGVAGAVATGLWLIPAFGSDTTLRLLALLPLLAVLGWSLSRPVPRPVVALTLAAVALLGTAAWLRPPVDLAALVTAVNYRYSGVPDGRAPNYRYLAEGRSGVISLIDYSGDVVYLQKNGIKEAKINSLDARKGTLAESLLAFLPSVFRPDAQQAFVVGFGGGTTARVLAATQLERVQVVELEPKVVEAMFSIGREKFDFVDGERVVLTYNDARNALLLDGRHYDLILSQPSHPWLAGSTPLFSSEFFALAHGRLVPGGVFGQWLNLFRMDTTTLKAVLRSFYEVFPHGAVFGIQKTGDLLLFGSDEALVLDYARSKVLFDDPDIRTTLNYGGLRDLHLLPSHFLFTRETLMAVLAEEDGTMQVTDANLLIETRLARLYEPPDGAEDPYRFLREVLHRRAAKQP